MSNPASCQHENKISPNPIVEIGQGALEGYVLKSRLKRPYYAFYGVPYAAQPKRFEEPQHWESWTGTLDATKARDRCIQCSIITKKVFGSENCLFLNVFTPFLPSEKEQDGRLKNNQAPSLLPVMVYIHGGGYYVGGGDLYGGKLLVDQDVVLVTLNYRLGALGFLNDGEGEVPGNMGLKDQVMCLQWIQENIGTFGGDKTNVTLFGESAGAACVHFHMMSPRSTGLFHRAVMQSGGALNPWSFMEDPLYSLETLARQLQLDCNISDTGDVIEALRNIEATHFATQSKSDQSGDFIWFGPSVESGDEEEKKFLAAHPKTILDTGHVVNEVPLMLGVNANEGGYKAIPILDSPSKLRELNENWSIACHPFMLYSKSTRRLSLSQRDICVRAVRNFYFKEKEISAETKNDFCDLVSDRYFNYGVQKCALYHRSFHKPENPVFLYLFDYEGEFSYLHAFGTLDVHGATHADELQYLMNQRIFFSSIKRGTMEDFMIDKLTQLWSAFARNGQPKHNFKDFKWMPLDKENDSSNLQYYKISKDDEIIVDPFKNRMEFWDTLPDHF